MEGVDLARLRDDARGYWELAVAPERVTDAAGLTLYDGPLALALHSGRLVGVDAVMGAHRVPVGVAFSGAATAKVGFDGPHEATRFANHMVVAVGREVADLAPVAAGGPWGTSVDQAVLLGPAALEALGGGAPATRDGFPALPRIRDRLREMTDPLPSSGQRLLDFTDLLAPQALLAAKAGLVEPYAERWYDLHTPDRYGLVEDPRLPGAKPADGWLIVHHDPSGAAFRGGVCGELLSAGRDHEGDSKWGRLAWYRCEGGPPLSVARTEMEVTAAVDPPGFDLSVKISTRLQVRAGEAGLQAFPIALTGVWEEVLEHRWSVAVYAEDGTQLDLGWAKVDEARPRPPDVVWAVLPERLAPGATASVRVEVADQWPFYNANLLDRGPSTGVRAPMVAPAVLRAALHGEARLRVTPPAGRSGEKLQTPISAPLGSFSAGSAGATWGQDRGEGRPAFAIGGYAEPAVRPAVKLASGAWLPEVLGWGLRHDGAVPEGTAAAVQSVLGWMSELLPSLPMERLHVVLPTSWFRGTPALSTGMIDAAASGRSPSHWSLASVDAKALERALIRRVTQQMWGGVVAPRSARDVGTVAAIADLYAIFGLPPLIGEAAAEEWRRVVVVDCEKALERHLSKGLVNLGTRSSACSPYLLARGLRERIGAEALLAGLDRLAIARAGATVTVEEVQQAIQTQTDVDLGPIFEGWVHVGFVPALSLEWSRGPDGSLSGVLRSDVPFGRTEVPVGVLRGDGMTYHWVTITDGVGRWSAPAGEPPRSVEVDPGRWILATKRLATEVSAASGG